MATQPAGAVRPDQLIHQMIGRDLAVIEPTHCGRSPGEVVLEVRGLSSPGRFGDVSFGLRRGEILGFAGLVGAGRSEVAQALFGLDPEVTGEVVVRGKALPLGDPQSALAAGMGLLPEDRKRQGLVLTMNCRENTSLAILPRLARVGFLDLARERTLAAGYVERLQVKTPEMDASIAGLSGGNQQKLALAKWLARECDILIVDEPTRGVDVGAKAEIHRLLDSLACEGVAVILISSELPEVMGLSSRILVLREGAVVAEVAREQFSQAGLMRWMAGAGSGGGREAGLGSVSGPRG